jgi:hypothetical protein
MSSAVILINRLGVAVAADSASTIGNRKAIFISAQKIFPIGKEDSAQVLAITFDAAVFMNVPVELLLKKYSNHVNQHGFSKLTIQDYMQDFIRFVEEQKELFHFKESEEIYLFWLIRQIFNDFKNEFKELSSDMMDDKNYQNTLESIYIKLSKKNKEEIKDHNESDESNQIKNMIGKDFIKEKYPKLIEEAFRYELSEGSSKDENKDVDPEKIVLDKKEQQILKHFTNYVYEKIGNRNAYRKYSRCGIYFVGYGNSSLYPSYWGIDAYAFLNGKFVYENDYRRSVTNQNRSYYKPLAQDDSIEAFIVGANFITRFDIWHMTNTSIQDKFKELYDKNKDQKKLIEKIQEEISKTLLNLKYFDSIEDKANQTFLSALATMGISDMTEYAEKMISLQSLKRKYELDSEYNSTVGGPTDVAIITKFEGFKWIKFKG